MKQRANVSLFQCRFYVTRKKTENNSKLKQKMRIHLMNENECICREILYNSSINFRLVVGCLLGSMEGDG